MPAEAGIVERAVSFTKGCYVGQETVARLHWKGKPNRHLRGLKLSAPVAAGAAVTVAGERVRRRARSAASARPSCRRSAGPIALAILRREVAPGDHVLVGEDAVEAQVVTPPLA